MLSRLKAIKAWGRLTKAVGAQDFACLSLKVEQLKSSKMAVAGRADEDNFFITA